MTWGASKRPNGGQRYVVLLLLFDIFGCSGTPTRHNALRHHLKIYSIVIAIKKLEGEKKQARRTFGARSFFRSSF